MDKEAREMINEHGFIIHYVFGYDFPLANCHTHGLLENYGHLELQIVLAVPKEAIHGILWNLVDKIKQGKKFKDGDLIEDIIENLPLKAMEVRKPNESLLRILLPDPNGKFPDDKNCDPYYAKQTTDPITMEKGKGGCL